MSTPAQQVVRGREVTTVRLTQLRTDGLARLRTLVADGTPFRVKPSSWSADFDSTAATVHGDAVVLQLAPRWDGPGPAWTLVLAPFGPRPEIPAEARKPLTYLLQVAPPGDLGDLPTQPAAMRGVWLPPDGTGEPLELAWASQHRDLTEPLEHAPLATVGVNTAGARFLRGMQGLDPDGDAPLLLDGVAADHTDLLDEVGGKPMPPAMLLTFSSNLAAGDIAHRSIVVLGPHTLVGTGSTYGGPAGADTHPYAPLIDHDAMRRHARELAGIDLDDTRCVRQLVAAGLTNILWRNTELENIHAGTHLDLDDDERDTLDAAAARLRGTDGWAPADRYAIGDVDMMKASVSVTTAIRDVLATWPGFPTPLPLDEIATLDPTLRFTEDTTVPASTWLGSCWDSYARSRARKAATLRAFARTWTAEALVLLAALHAAKTVPFFHGLPWHDELLTTVSVEHPELADTVEIARCAPWQLTDEQADALRWPLQRHDRDVADRWAGQRGRVPHDMAMSDLAWLWHLPL